MSKQLRKSPIGAALLGLTTVLATSGHAQAETRTFTIAALEPRGGANVDQEPFPTEPLPVGPGYVLNKPDQTGRWEVVVYLFTPSQIIVNQDDDITLEFVGINGKSHPPHDNRGLRQVVRAEARARHQNQLQGRQDGGVPHRVSHAHALDEGRTCRVAAEVKIEPSDKRRRGAHTPDVRSAIRKS